MSSSRAGSSAPPKKWNRCWRTAGRKGSAHGESKSERNVDRVGVLPFSPSGLLPRAASLTPSAIQLAPHHRHQSDHAASPVGEQIRVLQLDLNPARKLA